MIPGEIVATAQGLGDELVIAQCDLERCNEIRSNIFNFKLHRRVIQGCIGLYRVAGGGIQWSFDSVFHREPGHYAAITATEQARPAGSPEHEQDTADTAEVVSATEDVDVLRRELALAKATITALQNQLHQADVTVAQP